jgi:hypothetical protein
MAKKGKETSFYYHNIALPSFSRQVSPYTAALTPAQPLQTFKNDPNHTLLSSEVTYDNGAPHINGHDRLLPDADETSRAPTA